MLRRQRGPPLQTNITRNRHHVQSCAPTSNIEHARPYAITTNPVVLRSIAYMWSWTLAPKGHCLSAHGHADAHLARAYHHHAPGAVCPPRDARLHTSHFFQCPRTVRTVFTRRYLPSRIVYRLPFHCTIGIACAACTPSAPSRQVHSCTWPCTSAYMYM